MQPKKLSFCKIAFSFKGRIGRRTFWRGCIGLSIVFLILLISGASIKDTHTNACGLLYLADILLVIWVSLALTIKRWHDRNKSGWWNLINLVPGIGTFWWFIELGLVPGAADTNRLEPQYPENAAAGAPPPPPAQAQALVYTTEMLNDYIMLLAAITHSDSRPSANQIRVIEKIFNNLFKAPEQDARAWQMLYNFEKHFSSTENHIQKFHTAFKNSPELLSLVLNSLFVVATADGGLSEENGKILNEISQTFGIRCEEFENFKNRRDDEETIFDDDSDDDPGEDFEEGDDFSDSAGDTEEEKMPEPPKDDAYYAKILGIPVDAGAEAIKARYKELVKSNHPDKAAGLDENIKKFAESRMKEINGAYNYFRGKRKF